MSWEQLQDIVREATQRTASEGINPVACPNDGEPLKRGRNGVLHCPYDGWTSSQ